MSGTTESELTKEAAQEIYDYLKLIKGDVPTKLEIYAFLKCRDKWPSIFVKPFEYFLKSGFNLMECITKAQTCLEISDTVDAPFIEPDNFPHHCSQKTIKQLCWTDLILAAEEIINPEVERFNMSTNDKQVLADDYLRRAEHDTTWTPDVLDTHFQSILVNELSRNIDLAKKLSADAPTPRLIRFLDDLAKDYHHLLILYVHGVGVWKDLLEAYDKALITNGYDSRKAKFEASKILPRRKKLIYAAKLMLRARESIKPFFEASMSENTTSQTPNSEKIGPDSAKMSGENRQLANQLIQLAEKELKPCYRRKFILLLIGEDLIPIQRREVCRDMWPNQSDQEKLAASFRQSKCYAQKFFKKHGFHIIDFENDGMVYYQVKPL